MNLFCINVYWVVLRVDYGFCVTVLENKRFVR